MAHPVSYMTEETLSGTRTLTVAEVTAYTIMSFDPGGAARNLDLPAEASCAGQILMISNEADDAEVITIRDDATATICTPTQNEAALLFCNGTKWFGLVGATS